MQVTIRLHGVFRIDRFKEKTIDCPSGTQIRDIVEQLNLPANLLGTILLNDSFRDGDALLKDGDTLVLLPILEGG
ncbi:MAG: MoaD/ThiS family protein [Deltaproteobacteria bacterium]|nr:MoaD/ThiS family protein [Deltaproteobacteria bacterium]MBW2477487.1 MoaD/ThiS family protein [Deltaproteobacteria bacterium]MBW2504422.1 MoaD/ThiS family protein [Deltaproteobacteria bacterium]MBW2520642.1 MoaD/ThiS family protein [Deltaproteobacteria bacterium]